MSGFVPRRDPARILLPDPDRFDHEALLWGWRLNAPDLCSREAYRWPFPGNWAYADGPFTTGGNECPSTPGDGICIAKTLLGAQSGGRSFTNSVGLHVAYYQQDVLAESDKKLRVTACWVADQFDPVAEFVHAAKRADLRNAYLSGAYLSGADLSGAYLRNAYLRNAYLSGANLSGAYLSGANLSGADLSGAYLRNAYLSGANLSGANLSGANLRNADLSGAALSGADLSGADLRNANLRNANLSGAYLSGADLRSANLSGAYYTQWTLWPAGVDPTTTGAVKL